jgi:hypothetical protein
MKSNYLSLFSHVVCLFIDVMQPASHPLFSIISHRKNTFEIWRVLSSIKLLVEFKDTLLVSVTFLKSKSIMTSISHTIRTIQRFCNHLMISIDTQKMALVLNQIVETEGTQNFSKVSTWAHDNIIRNCFVITIWFLLERIYTLFVQN